MPIDTVEGGLITHDEYEKQLLGWVKQRGNEGLEVLKRERGYVDMGKSIEWINGDQVPLRTKAISKIVDNRLRKIVLETVSAMTDVRPIWNYETHVDNLKKQSEIYNSLARNWWRNGHIDRKLQAILTFACAGGTGYGCLTWNPTAPGGGDFELIPYDPRNVIPIGAVYSDSVQDWEGVILRQRISMEEGRRRFPSKAYAINKSTNNWLGPPTRYGGKMLDLVTSVWGVIKGNAGGGTHDQLPTTFDLLTIYFKDDTKNTGNAPRRMGDPDSNFSYVVYPIGSLNPITGKKVTSDEAMLYPRGRLVICTPDAILSDGPNPNWHGFFPVIKFTLDPLPWLLLGSSLVQDLMPLQNALNEALRGCEDGIGQWVRRGVVADRSAISPAELKAIDTRKSGMQALINSTAGEGFKVVDGPQLPEWYMAMIQLLIQQMDENSGVRGLQQLSQLNQMPAADTIEKFMDALSPMLRMRGRSLEVALAEVAEMLKVGFLQYYNAGRRVEILGKDGLTWEDFDYDPGHMVPDQVAGADPQSRESRAVTHARNFSFTVAPNSFLNVSHATQKMLILQLFRDNGVDIYSLWEALDLPNIGPIPAENIPDRMIAARKRGLQMGPTPEMVQVQEAAAIAQAQAAISQIQAAIASGGMPLNGPAGQPTGPQAGGGPPPQAGGQPPPGQLPSRVGRPPSGQQVPQMVMKDGGQRAVISESGR